MFLNYGPKQKLFSKDVMSSVGRTLLTQHITPISSIKQSMHIIILFHCNCFDYFNNLPNNYTKNTKSHELPLVCQSTWSGFLCVVQNNYTATTSAVKHAHTRPIGALTNTIISQNTKHKKGFNINILCTQNKWLI